MSVKLSDYVTFRNAAIKTHEMYFIEIFDNCY